jgi:hypothetical protein
MKKTMHFWGLDWDNRLVYWFIGWLGALLAPISAILVISHIKPAWILNGVGLRLVIAWGVLSILSSFVVGFYAGKHRCWKHLLEIIVAGTLGLLLWCVIAMNTSVNGPTGDAVVRENILILAIPVALALGVPLYIGAGIGALRRRMAKKR